MRDIKFESADFEVSCDAEVMEIAEPTGYSFGHLQQAVDRFHGGVGQPGFQVSQNAVKMGF